MKIVYSEDHNLHNGLLAPRGDEWGPSSECPARANNVASTHRESGFGEFVEPQQFLDDSFYRIHKPDYVDFLKTIWTQWEQSDEIGSNARPDTFVAKGMRHADTDC